MRKRDHVVDPSVGGVSKRAVRIEVQEVRKSLDCLEGDAVRREGRVEDAAVVGDDRLDDVPVGIEELVDLDLTRALLERHWETAELAGSKDECIVDVED